MSDRWRGPLRLLVTLSLAALLVGMLVTADPPAEDRAQAIGEQIRCPVCQGESIADTPSGLGRDMMELVRERVDQGYSDEQIIQEVLASYSEAQRLDPPLSASTVALWAVPALAGLVGLWLLAGRLRRPQEPRSDPVPTRVESGEER